MDSKKGSLEIMGLNTVNPSFWNNKKVFITGNTGFKGSWMNFWLNLMGAEVCGYSLPLTEEKILFKSLCIEKTSNQVFADINDYDTLRKNVFNFKPEIVFHMAAQPLVRESYKNPLSTISTNVLGTANILECLKSLSSVKVCSNSDKCYENSEKEEPYVEGEPMGGYDPYSSSKGCAELITSSFRRSFYNCESSKCFISEGRYVIGGEIGQKFLDAIKSFSSNKPVLIRFPKSIRPWQDVLDPLRDI